MPEVPSYVIVGASGGIGTALCHQLAARGPCKLVLVARDAARVGQLAAALQTEHPTPPAVSCHALDALDPQELAAAFDAAAAEFGPITGVVNLCGSILLKPAHSTSDREFADTLAANLVTAFNVLRAAARAMPAGGSIVLVSSAAARIGIANHEAVAAAKAGVTGLTLSAAATYASRNLRVNAVAPGLVRTPLAEKITGSEPALKASTAMHPLGRIGEPNDVAGAIAWLLNPATTWVTGQVIGVDGGLASVRGR